MPSGPCRTSIFTPDLGATSDYFRPSLRVYV
jgi:hypothetical protein